MGGGGDMSVTHSSNARIWGGRRRCDLSLQQPLTALTALEISPDVDWGATGLTHPFARAHAGDDASAFAA